MSIEINPKYIAKVCAELQAIPKCKTATMYVSEKFIVKATWSINPRGGKLCSATILVTYGKPNYLERLFIANCLKAGEKFPVKKVQFRFYPKKTK